MTTLQIANPYIGAYHFYKLKKFTEALRFNAYGKQVPKVNMQSKAKNLLQL
jgi:hypothetical protein